MTYHVSCNAAGDAEPTEVGRYLTEAFDVAQCWEDQPEAKALLAKIDMLERLSDMFAGDEHLSDASRELSGCAETLRDCDLYMLRSRLLHASFPEDSDPSDYDLDRADDLAPSIEDALNRARKAGLGLQIAPFSDGADLLAAQVYQLGNGRSGVAL